MVKAPGPESSGIPKGIIPVSSTLLSMTSSFSSGESFALGVCPRRSGRAIKTRRISPPASSKEAMLMEKSLSRALPKNSAIISVMHDVMDAIKHVFLL